VNPNKLLHEYLL